MNGTRETSLFVRPLSSRLVNIGDVTDNQYRLRKITSQGKVTTFAGAGTTGYLDGDALSARY
jgi:hypothetical protein